jgi:hypothetical protein
MGLRVSEEEEIEGLDIGEHRKHAWELIPSTVPFDDAHLRGHSAPGRAARVALHHRISNPHS